MYKRFLNNADYLSIVTEEALSQLIRDREERLAQAEEAAEASIVEYLTENYEIEKALAIGKNLLKYNEQTTYPVGAHFYLDNKIMEVIRTINGRKSPTIEPYWEECCDIVDRHDHVRPYSQTQNYQPGDIVMFSGIYYKCLQYNGTNYNDIRIPGINAWTMKEDVCEWVANYQYNLWDVVEYEGHFYTLIKLEQEGYGQEETEEPEEQGDPIEELSDIGDEEDDGDGVIENEETPAPKMDLTINPYESECWGLIGDYDETYEYELSENEYVAFNGAVFYPTMNPNHDEPQIGYNIQVGDPRNGNIKKHMLRLAVYELHKLISPNNVSSARITDYETSIMWLRDASRLKINPQIPRKLDEEKKPVADFAVATFMRDYDPNKNPWQI